MWKFLSSFNSGFSSLLMSESNLLSMESLANWLHPGDSHSQQLISSSTLASKKCTMQAIILATQLSVQNEMMA